MPLPPKERQGHSPHGEARNGFLPISRKWTKLRRVLKTVKMLPICQNEEGTCHSCLTECGRVKVVGTQILRSAARDGPRILNVVMPDWCGYEKAAQQQSGVKEKNLPVRSYVALSKQCLVSPTPASAPTLFPFGYQLLQMP